jgi:hypothetical protein
MQLLPFLQELVLGFLVYGIEYAAVNRANLNAFRFIKPADALGAFGRVDHVYGFALFYGFIFAFGLTGAAADTIICNFVSHLCSNLRN